MKGVFATCSRARLIAIFVQDLAGVILDVNPGACAIYGQSAPEIIGRNIGRLLSEEKLCELLARVPNLSRGEVVHAEAVIKTSEGGSTPVAISGSRIEYTGLPALLLHVRDISEQKKLQEQFHQSQKMEAIGQLAGGIAHDFNNLLTAIIGYNELMLQGLNELDPLRDSAEEVRKAAERAAAPHPAAPGRQPETDAPAARRRPEFQRLARSSGCSAG